MCECYGSHAGNLHSGGESACAHIRSLRHLKCLPNTSNDGDVFAVNAIANGRERLNICTADLPK